jgi:glycerol-3-phosphate O-acyltransferase
VRRVVYAMLRRLERERRTATGPAAKPPDRVRHELLRSPKLQASIKQLAELEEESPGALTRKADSLLRKLQATPEGSTIGALEVLLDRVFHRIYAGIDVDREGLARVREASKEGSVVLLPSHKSHVDYLIVSYVFNDENLQLPLIAAGDNLSFFPLGPVFRRAGAFFIRRSFKGDRLYASIVDAYIRRLIREGFPIELFVEGGRSRTGKLLPPKFGLLSMIVEGALALPSKKVSFVPISIGYERIVETGAYHHEMAGGEKVKEDAAGLLKTTDVLRHRYGRINLQFGTILSLDEVRGDLGFAPEDPITPTRRRAIVTRLGNRVMDEINRVTAVTPGALTALALLSHSRRGLPHEELVLRCERLLDVLIELAARVTPATATASGRLRPGSIRESAQMFVNAELIQAHAPAEVDARRSKGSSVVAGAGVIYTIAPEKRLELDTTKNIVVHFFVERALVATALLASPGPSAPVDVVRDRVRRLSRLFKLEFRFRADKPFDEIFRETVLTMVAAHEIVELGTHLGAGPGRKGWNGHEWLTTYAAFVQNFVESYRIAARGLGALLKGALGEKDLVKKALATGQRMFFSGEVERSEAISQPTVKNAYTVFRELGYLRAVDGKLELVDPSPEAVRIIESEVAGYLHQEVPN